MSITPSSFEVHPSSGVPIYLQVIEQVHALLAGGHLAEGDMLPSVRQMAAQLGVNMMTISKAYSRLEADGTVERARGKGMVIREQSLPMNLTHRLKELRPHIEQMVVRGRQLGLNDAQIQTLVRKILKEINK